MKEGYLQTKIKELQEQNQRLTNENKTFRFELDRINRAIESTPKSDLDAIAKTVERKVIEDSKEFINKERLNLKVTLENIAKEYLIKELDKKTEDYDAVNTKTMRVCERLMEDYEEKQLFLNELKHRLETLTNLLLYKKLFTKKEYEMAFRTYKRRNRIEKFK